MKVYNEERFLSHLNPDKPRDRGLITPRTISLLLTIALFGKVCLIPFIFNG